MTKAFSLASLIPQFLLLIAASIALTQIAGCSETPRPIPVGANAFYYGHIEDGEKFGVMIGARRSDARMRLESAGFSHYSMDQCSYQVKILTGCSDSFSGDLYDVDDILRRGTIIIEVIDGNVSAIIWDFQALPASDL